MGSIRKTFAVVLHIVQEYDSEEDLRESAQGVDELIDDLQSVDGVHVTSTAWLNGEQVSLESLLLR